MTRETSWDISAQLRAILKERKMTQKLLAEKTGIGREDINRFAAEDNPRHIGRARAQRIADALDLTVLDLGLPPEEAGEVGRNVLDRLEELATDVADSARKQAAMATELRQLRGRVQHLEARPWPGEDQSTGQDGDL